MSDAIVINMESEPLVDKSTTPPGGRLQVELKEISYNDNAEEVNDAEVAMLLGAAGRNDRRKVMKLLRGGAVNASSSDYDKRTALHLASSENCLETAKLLVQEKANINLKDRFGCTPLDDAISNNHRDIISFLKSAGATIGHISKFEAEYIQASADGDVEAVKQYLDNGVDVNSKDYDRRSALHLAVCEGHVELAKVLIERGADPKAEDRFGSTPADEASRHAVRSGFDQMKALFHSAEETPAFFDAFSLGMVVFEIIMIILFFVLCEYDELAIGSDAHGTNSTVEASIEMMRRYPQFMDVHVMIFVGFGFLMVFLKKNAFNALGLTFLVSAFAIQWHILAEGLLHMAFKGHYKAIALSLDSMILGDFAAGAVLITYGVLLGKVTPSQMMVLTFLEVIFYTVNELIAGAMGITDIGGSMVIHMFGAFFGLSCSFVMKNKASFDNDNNASVYHSDVFAMIGTLFLWMYWPSFNGVLGSESQQMRVTINTVLSLCGSCVFAYIFSYILRRERRFNMVDIQNATLAGGVAMGTCAELLIGPGAAFLIGGIAGTVSVWGYVHLQPWLEQKASIHDTCGVNNLHGMPSLVGAIAGIIAVALADPDTYGRQWGDVIAFGGITRSPKEQALQQLYYMLVTLVISISTGLLTGVLVKNLSNLNKDVMFKDEKYWEVPSLEQPYYFDHRGELQRSKNFHGDQNNMDAMKLVEMENRMASIEDRNDRSSIANTSPQMPGMPGMNMGYPIFMNMPPQPAPQPAAPAQDNKLESLFMNLISKLDAKATAKEE